jgi:uroporphyrinogen-III synthase
VLAAQLTELGAEPILIPTIAIAPPEDDGPLTQALAELDRYDWLIFTSANAAEVFAARFQAGQPHPKIAAIGPATARLLKQNGLAVDLIPEEFVAESLAEALLPNAPGARMLLLRAAVARDHLPNALTAAGASLTIVEAYRTVVPEVSIAALSQLFAEPSRYPDAVTFTSASTAHNLAELLRIADRTLPPAIVRASIGPITSHALDSLGWPPTVEAKESTIPSLVQALVEYFPRS